MAACFKTCSSEVTQLLTSPGIWALEWEHQDTDFEPQLSGSSQSAVVVIETPDCSPIRGLIHHIAPACQRCE